MPVLNCCTGCQGPMCGPCGCCGGRTFCGMGPPCVHTRGNCCCSGCCDCGVIHGARCGRVAGSYFSCGHGCIGGCIGGLCRTCCGPACG
ncbi:hypothetical protein NE865_00280 [Phthorimaea operculella]|nr:hypothetical protein NE865_00280 [Phthorimaea operculella]